jgi:serine/threonine protein kinase
LLGDLRHFVFKAHAHGIPQNFAQKPDEPNCVAKLVTDHYGSEVHQALAPNFAPTFFGCSSKPSFKYSIYLMEYLQPPSHQSEGWKPLSELSREFVSSTGVEKKIFSVLREIVRRLQELNSVHGDLRPNNLMIKMRNLYAIADPVVIKVVDFEWADRVGQARYPVDRNEELGYPGEAGALIGPDDDSVMVDQWVQEQQVNQ